MEPHSPADGTFVGPTMLRAGPVDRSGGNGIETSGQERWRVGLGSPIVTAHQRSLLIVIVLRISAVAMPAALISAPDTFAMNSTAMTFRHAAEAGAEAFDAGANRVQ
ncbi:hypothetical protein GCM10009632_47640 [Mycolicibacterium alvei]|uniref:Uncharacterized protein n=1 Tax=Mycolicibacterium alvei TaxID=67081 RepID=A0A6N4V291_9MYCO|nr:hypothetical protein MALV_57930 [Mycolicibacterium alvei]